MGEVELMRTRSKILRLAVPLAAVLLVANGCGDDDEDEGATTTAAPDTSEPGADGIVVGAGISDPEDATIAVLEFLPERISVEVGTPVTWEWNGAEPHSVTFLEPGQELPPPGDESVFGPTSPTGPYDGSTFVNSGLQPLGPVAPEPFEMSFSAAGTYPYYCVIHPLMVGEVEVVEAGGTADAPADVAQRRADETDQWLEEGRATKAALLDAEPAQAANPDGSTTWTVAMGATTEHVDILAFAPTPADVRAGDTVRFLNSSGAPHTATFFGEGAEPILSPVDPRVEAPAPGPSPQALSSEGLFNTGLLPPDAPPGAGPPEAVRSFSFTVPDAGTYSYVCILHASSEMVGEIIAT
jgi:plastocyanin